MIPSGDQPLPETSGRPRRPLPLKITINTNITSEYASHLSSSRRADSCRSTATPMLSGSKSATARHVNYTKNISDFFNSKQINQAISSAEGVTDRLKVIDFILKRRVELKNAENKVRLDRAAPIIKNFRQNVKQKLNNGKNFNKFRAAFKDIELPEGNLEASSKMDSSVLSGDDSYGTLTKLPVKATKGTVLQRQNNLLGEIRRRLPSIDFHAPAPLGNTIRRLSFQLEQPLAITADDPNGNPGQPVKEPSIVNLVKQDSGHHVYSKNQIIEKFYDLMNVKKAKIESTTSTRTKLVIKPLPITRVISKTAQDEAKKRLEHDLLNYLARHGPQDRKIISELRTPRDTKMKTIEIKALAKFRSAQNSPSHGDGSYRFWNDKSSGANTSRGLSKRVTVELPSPVQKRSGGSP